MDLDALRVPLNAQALRTDLTGANGPWQTLEVVNETGSTNADLITRAAAGEDIDGAVLIAEHQNAGRGRNGRQWTAAPHAQLIVSVGLSAKNIAPHAWGWLPLAAGIAVVDTLSKVATVASGLKWPNDVLAGTGVPRRKIAGVLAEVASPRPAIVVGIGLNVTMSGAEVGESTSSSLLELGATSTDRDELLRALLTELAKRAAQWRAGDPDLAADYRDRSVTIGHEVRALLPGDRHVTGTATDVDSEGRLQINTGHDTVTVAAGDIVHLRAP